ncbi:MAG: DUF2284 domain-containing protein [Bacillota bacterium]|nr:DUF2284 domain-containing protein [Bacillota bacterium]
MFNFDLQQDDLCHLEEITAGYAFAEVLEIALKKDVFDSIAQGLSLDELSQALGFDPTATELFLKTLERLGLIGMRSGYVFNTPVAAKYLLSQSGDNATVSLLKKETDAKYLAKAISAYLPSDIMAGAALNNMPLPRLSTELNSFFPDLAFGGSEPYKFILAEDFSPSLYQSLAEKGVMIIMNKFAEINTAQSAVNALKAYCSGGEKPCSVQPVLTALKEAGIKSTGLIPLSRVWSMVIVGSEAALSSLIYNEADRLCHLLACEDIRSMKLISTAEVVAADWVADHCRWGCSSYGTKCCPPNSPTYKETQTSLATYSRALLIEGEPPTRSFQRLMLRNEKIAFKAGFYKAFAYWAGPCSLCTECKPPEPPLKCTATRPSMESAGIDVFATVRKQGYTLETRKDKDEFVKYFGLLLLD